MIWSHWLQDGLSHKKSDRARTADSIRTLTSQFPARQVEPPPPISEPSSQPSNHDRILSSSSSNDFKKQFKVTATARLKWCRGRLTSSPVRIGIELDLTSVKGAMPLDGYRNFETPNNCNGLITRTDPSSCQHLGAVCSPSLEASLLHRRESAGAWIVSVAAATARDHQNKEVLFKLLRGQGRSYDRIPDVLNTARRIIWPGQHI